MLKIFDDCGQVSPIVYVVQSRFSIGAVKLTKVAEFSMYCHGIKYINGVASPFFNKPETLLKKKNTVYLF